ncbi:caspase domain-containing protein [Gautieria morchelliformis]|nr:caspase domain-containing protein [Gautieria morchelliformis]
MFQPLAYVVVCSRDETVKYGYAEAGIHVLSDDGNHTEPTHDNIIDALRNLVKGAKPGDRFFFYYCGHGGQIHNKDGRETDRKDELILPSDYIDTHQDGEDSYSVERYRNHILDDELNNILVKSLPVGSQLVALFDCCNAGTMLDLEYYAGDYFEYYGADKSRYAEEPFSEACIFGDDVLKNATQPFVDNIVDSMARPFESGPPLSIPADSSFTGRRVTERGLRFRPESANPMTDASPKAHVAFIESLEDNMSPTYEELFHKLSEKLARASQEIIPGDNER